MKFVDARIKNILEDALSSEYLPAQNRTTNLRYILFAKQGIDDIALHPMLERMSTDC